jgi:hypothetical protein
MKKITFLGFLFLFSTGFSQSWLPIQHDTLLDRKHEIIFSGTGDYASTSLHKSLTNKLLFGGEITDDIKEKSLKLHRGINRFGLDLTQKLNIEIIQQTYSKKTRGGLWLKQAISHLSMLYTHKICMN